MNMFIDLTKRNIKLYLRDKSSVFVSLIGAIIVIALFVLFLGGQFVQNTTEMFSPFGVTDKNGIGALIFSWVLGGILVLNSITIPQTMLARIVLDRESKTTNDFYVIPFNKSILGLSYIASAMIIGTIITYISFLVGELYIFVTSGYLFSISTHFYIFGIILLCTTSFSAFMFLIYSFVRTSSTIGGLNAFTSSIGGFLAGIYITIGGLSGLTRNLLSSNPLAHGSAMVRSLLMDPLMDTLFKDSPNELVAEFTNMMGVNLYVGDLQLTNVHYIISLVALAAICFILSYFRLLRDKIS